VIKTRNM